MQSVLKEIEGIEIIPVTHINEVFDIALKKNYIADQSITASIDITEKESI